MKRFLSLILIPLCLTACGPTAEEKALIQKGKEYEAAEANKPENLEWNNPKDYLPGSTRFNPNLIASDRIEMTVHNKAKHTMYKDMVIEYSFLTKTGAFIEVNTITIYEYFPPNKKTDVRVKVAEAPDGWKNSRDKFKVRIISAIPTKDKLPARREFN